MADTAPVPLVFLFADVDAPRRSQARQHTLEDILLIAPRAVIGGAAARGPFTRHPRFDCGRRFLGPTLLAVQIARQQRDLRVQPHRVEQRVHGAVAVGGLPDVVVPDRGLCSVQDASPGLPALHGRRGHATVRHRQDPELATAAQATLAGLKKRTGTGSWTSSSSTKPASAPPCRPPTPGADRPCPPSSPTRTRRADA